MATKQNIRVIHALLAKAGLMHSKADIISTYGVESTTLLTDAQALDLTERLNKMIESRTAATNETRRWRSNVLVNLNRCGVYAEKGDWRKVNAFLLNPRIAGKLLYEMDVYELQALNRKLCTMARKFEEARARNLIFNTTQN